MFKKFVIPTVAVVAVGAGYYVAYRAWRNHKPSPTPQPPTPTPSECAPLVTAFQTGADIGYGEVDTMAAESPITATLGAATAEIGALYFAWTADSVTKKLVIDAPKTHLASDGIGTLAEADGIYFDLTGLFADASMADLKIQPTSATFKMGDGEEACVEMRQVRAQFTGAALKMSRKDGKPFPKNTILPGINLNLIQA